MSDSAETDLPRRLNLGCGFDKRTGYLNVDLNDFHAPDLVADITHLPMLPSGHFTEIVAQDVLEHLERSKAPVALAEWSRLLAPGGILVVRIPSLLHMFKMLASPAHRAPPDAEIVIHLLFGTQAYNGDYHLNGFTPQTLLHHLSDVGLLLCRAAIRDEWMFDITARKTAQLDDPEEWLQHAYFSTLDRPADTNGIAYYRSALKQGRIARKQIITELEGSEEAALLRGVQPPAALEIARLRHEISALKSSLSWRITAPLRRVLQALGRH